MLAAQRANSDRVSGSREQPLGINVAALSWIGPARHDAPPGALAGDHAQDQGDPLPLLDTLTAWCRTISDDRGLTVNWLGAHCDQLVAFLAVTYEWATAQPWALDMCEEIRDQAAHGRAVTRQKPDTQNLYVPCPTCRERPCEEHGEPKCRTCPYPTVRRIHGEKGGQTVECRECGRIWRDSEYRFMAAGMAADLVASGDTGQREADPDDERSGAVPGPGSEVVPPLGA
jgi:hypothetical protein